MEETAYADANGNTKVRIVGFAQFFIEGQPNQQSGSLKGYFLQYVKGGIYQKAPPPEPNIKTIRLVKPDNGN